jgi:hypothetical protein
MYWTGQCIGQTGQFIGLDNVFVLRYLMEVFSVTVSTTNLLMFISRIQILTGLTPCSCEANRSYSKGNAIPIQAWAEPEGSSKLTLSDFKAIGT